MKIYFSFLVVVLLSGCALGIDPASLSAPITKSSFVLAQDITFEESRGMSTFRITLSKGEYTSIKEDKQGIYYEGPEENYFLDLVSGELDSRFHGGFWISKSATPRVVRTFHYLRETEHTKSLRARSGGSLGLITEADMKRNAGRIYLADAIGDEFVVRTVTNQSGMEWQRF